MSGMAASKPAASKTSCGVSAEAMIAVGSALNSLKACKDLATELKFSKVELMKINTFVEDDTGYRIIDKWYGREGENATGQVLHKALLASGLKWIADAYQGHLLKGLSGGAASVTGANTAGSGQVSSNKDGPATSCMSRAPDLDNEEVYYPMNRKPRGIACIISNKDFPTLCKRDGTDVDVEQLDKLWTKFGFQTRILRDCTGQQMLEKLRELALEDHSNYNSVIVCILTHGLGEKLYGSDEELVPSKELVQLFDGRSVHQSLVNKPRLFFVQACRTDGIAAGGDNIPDTGATTSHEFPGNNTADGVSWPSPPADMFFAGSSAPGYVSWLNSKDGAWFIQGVVKIFLENAKDDHLSDLMIKVKRYVQQKFQQHGYVRQVPSTTDQLTRKLHFRPGFYK